MSISSLLDGGGRELYHKFGFDQRHLSEDVLDTETSSIGSEPVEELHGQATSTSRVRGR